MPKNTFKGGQKKRKQRKAKNVNQRQNQRLKKLENLIMPAVERKSRDILASAAGISSSGYANQPMFQVEQGDGKNQRIGDKVTLLSHNVSMTLAAQDTTNSIRIIWAYTPSTTALSISDVLEYGNYTTYGDQVFSSPYKRNAATAETTYRVLFDKVYHFHDSQRLLTDKYQLIPSKKGKQMNFNAVGSVMPENYQLQILAISDSTAAAHPAISYVCRSVYLDL
jgi:hypothetical protein